MLNHKNRRGIVLAASCVTAAIIMSCSTFAWLTASDEVINRLSARTNYQVWVLEDFSPPDGWVPGQVVEKHVRATNVGDVDAFLKMTVRGDMLLTKRDQSVSVTASNRETALQKAVELTGEGLASRMAGARLVYRAGAAAGTDGYTYDEAALQGDGVTVDLSAGAQVSVDPVTGDVQFAPDTTGYYLFARSSAAGESGETTVVYDGYYYDAASAACYEAEITASEENVFRVKAALRQKKTVAVSNEMLSYEWAKEKPTDTVEKLLRVRFAGDAGDEDDVMIDIHLTNLSDWTRNLEDGGKTAAFYYNKILRSGGTTSNVMESVLLSAEVLPEAFYSMTYNMKITADSAQIVDGDVVYEAVNAQDWANAPGRMMVTAVSGETVTWEKRT